MEIKKPPFCINSTWPTRGHQNKFLYPLLLQYRDQRVSDPESSQKAFEQIICFLDHLVIRYSYVAKKWPKRKDFDESYYRDWYRLRDCEKVNTLKQDLQQELRYRMIYQLRKYRTSYKAPVGGYCSRALYYGVLLAYRSRKREDLKEAMNRWLVNYLVKTKEEDPLWQEIPPSPVLLVQQTKPKSLTPSLKDGRKGGKSSKRI